VDEWDAGGPEKAYKRGQHVAQDHEIGLHTPFNPPRDFPEEYRGGYNGIVELNELRARKAAQGGCMIVVFLLGSSIIDALKRVPFS
jgi:hypothetical protein